MPKFFSSLGAPALTLVVLLAGWFALTLTGAVPAYVLPGPAAVLDALRSAFIAGTLYPHIWATSQATLQGFALGCCLGILFGCMLAEFRWLDMALYPLVFAIQSVPKIAFAPLIIAYFGFDTGSKVATAALLSFFPIFLNTAAGLKNSRPEILMLYRASSASRWRILFEAKLPAALGFIFAGLQVAFVMALLGCIVSEFVASTSGLGFIIKQRAGQIDIAMMFVAIGVLAGIGMAGSSILLALQNKLVFWEKASQDVAGAA